MKRIVFSIGFSFLTLVSFAQRVNLSLTTDDKISIHGFCYWQELHVKSKDTAFVHRLHSANPDVLKGLKPGTYWLTATSLFNHRVTKKVEVNKKTPIVKMKGLASYYSRVSETKNLSEKLKLNDTLYILYSASSDENVKEKIAVTKTKAGYVAIQYTGISNTVFQEMQFKDEYYKSVIKFESDAKKANSPKAETAPKAEVYTLVLNKEIVSFIVPGEKDGLNALKAALFIRESK